MSDRKALGREIAARTKPRFIEIKPERRVYKATGFIEMLTRRRGGMIAEEYRSHLIRKWKAEDCCWMLP